jgi:formamidopyrimidine-DNA glycosylase
MPELPEVRTVAKTLREKLLHKKIIDINVMYPKIIEERSLDIKNLISKSLDEISTYGKYLIFKFNDLYLISHLRMEGKFFIKTPKEKIEKHEHIIFLMNDNISLRYHDTRKFGRMFVTNDISKYKGLNKLGLEPFDDKLTAVYLLNNFKNKKLPIKEGLLVQEIIAGLGNIYANEVLFYAKVNPYKKCEDVTKEEADLIIEGARKILTKAIKEGGTTIRSYTSSLGVIGHYQDFLMVHKKEGENCKICNEKILRVKIGGRSTYYCPKCQK